MKIAKLYGFIVLAVLATAGILFATGSFTNQVILAFGFVTLAVSWIYLLAIFPQQMYDEVKISRNQNG